MLALILLGGHFSFAHFAATGFASVLQALAALCCLIALLRFGESPHPRNGAILGFALLFLALCRLDSAVFGLPLVACALFFAWQNGRAALPAIIVAMGIPSVLFGGVLLWKLSYYGDIFPATYYVKAAPESAAVDVRGVFLKSGTGYLIVYWRQYFLWALAGCAAFGAWRIRQKKVKTPAAANSPALLWTMAAMCVLWHGYMLRTGGDLYEFRLLTPQAPMMMILAVAGLRGLARHWRWAATAGALFFSALHWQTAPDPIPMSGGRALSNAEAQIPGGGRPDFKAPPESGLVQPRLLGLAFWDLFGHLGKYPPEVHVAHLSGGLPAYLTSLRWTDMWGYADSRIGRGAPEDVRALPAGAGVRRAFRRRAPGVACAHWRQSGCRDLQAHGRSPRFFPSAGRR